MQLDGHLLKLLLSALQINIALIIRQLQFHKQKIEAICRLMVAGNNYGILSPRLAKAKCKRDRRPRRFWVRPGRTQVWWKNFVNDIVVEEEWKENLRMTKKTFMELCQELSPYITKQQTHLREALDVETQGGITLYYLSDEGRYRKVANAFGVSRSSVSLVIRNVTRAISKHLGAKYIKLPLTKAEVEEQASKYLQHHGFPQCIGAIDGTHIEIKQPVDNYTDFLNRKGKYSFNVQALCDYRYVFTDVVIRWPGSVHDARIFANSNLNTYFRTEKISRNEKIIVPGQPPVPLCVIGDAAYPLLPFLMKEFPSGGNNTAEQFFSYQLSSARMPIECAFGRLKGRFGALRRPMDIKLDALPQVIHACFILHNICELKNESLHESVIRMSISHENNNQPSCQTLRNNRSTAEGEGKKIRNIFVQYFE